MSGEGLFFAVILGGLYALFIEKRIFLSSFGNFSAINYLNICLILF